VRRDHRGVAAVSCVRAPVVAQVAQGDVTQQLDRIEQAVDAIAIEVERISESQRFLTKLQERSVPAIE
jgi:hypothetical protein